jgi:hypothetical protein
MWVFCPWQDCREGFADLGANTHKGALEKPQALPYLAIAAPQWRGT